MRCWHLFLSYLVGEAWGEVDDCASEGVGCRDIGENVAEAVVLPWLAVEGIQLVPTVAIVGCPDCQLESSASRVEQMDYLMDGLELYGRAELEGACCERTGIRLRVGLSYWYLAEGIDVIIGVLQ